MSFTAPKVSAHRPRHSCWVLEELLVIAATQLSEMMKNIRPLDIKVKNTSASHRSLNKVARNRGRTGATVARPF